MICGACDKTDGLCYTSLPPKVKCTLTGKYHSYHDECSVEVNMEQKPLSEWTLGEVKTECKKKSFCGKQCPLFNVLKCSCNCFSSYYEDKKPANWDLTDKPKLTDGELTICSLLGAKWIGRHKDADYVVLWPDNPVGEDTKKAIGSLDATTFPSIKPGDCICVEDCKA